MKAKFLLILALIGSLTITQAQSKNEIEKDLATCKTSNASLQKELDGLRTNYDSILLSTQAYDTMYNAIKEKVFLVDFNPLEMSDIIDSLRTGREEAFSDITTALNDSISTLAEENAILKLKLAGVKGESYDETIKILKKLKGLLDEKIITQEEFDNKKKELLEKL